MITIDQIRSKEKSLFLVDHFNQKSALFPEKVFVNDWDYICFLPFNDWFSNKKDYDALLNFLRLIESPSFIASAPPLYDVPPIEFELDTPLAVYNSKHAMVSSNDERVKGVGLRISSESFYYDRSCRWAMVGDLTHHLMLCGMEESVASEFKDSFENILTKFDVIKDLEEFYQRFHQVSIDRKEDILNNY